MITAMAEEPISETPSSARLNSETGEYDDGLSAFAAVRPRLFGIAYRMLGSAAEAEDIVQDVWLRWQATDLVANALRSSLSPSLHISGPA